MKQFHSMIAVLVSIAMMLVMSSCFKKINTNPGTNQNTQGQNGGTPNVNITDNSGNGIVVGQNMDWPSRTMGNLPQMKGKVTAVINSDQTHECAVTVSGCTKDDATAYVAQLKSLGYGNGMDMADSNGYLFTGTNSSNDNVTFSYVLSSGEATVSFASGLSVTPTTVNMADNAPWPGNFISGVPELTGKIDDVVNSNNTKLTVTVKYVVKEDFEAFIKQVKQNGYTVDADETSSVNDIRYEAYNANKEYICAYLSIDPNGNTASIDLEKPDSSD